MADHLIRCLLGDRPIRVVASLTTEAARNAARRHRVAAGGQVALARGTTSALLLATLTKGHERVTLQLMGDGALGSLTVDANDDGEVRAFLKNPAAMVPSAPGRRTLLGDALGRTGVVTVMRDLGLKDCFRGQSALVSGEIDEDVEGYLTHSEQIESALVCDAVLDSRDDIDVSGGVLVQCLPSASSSAALVAQLRDHLRGGAVYDALERRPDDAETLARAALGELGDDLEVLDRRPVRFSCRCSRDRVYGGLALVAEAELLAMIEEDGGAEVTCDFCSERYQLSAEELTAILEHREPHASA